MDKMELKALGKINLGLDVLGRRENGYHDVRMVMQTVYLYDQIVITKTKQPGVKAETNLFYLPVSAGMAGGSADAAAVLFGVNKMFGLGLSMTELEERGVKLGADVPYCLMRGTVLAEGIGEKLTPLLACPKCFVLLAKPPISVSTKMVYEKLDALEITEHPDIDGILNGLARKNIHKVAECMGNVLEQVTIPVYPVIEQIKNVMKEGGAMNAMMSGSGPTVFGLFEDRQSARRAAQKIKEQKLAKQVYVTSIHQARRK